MYIKYYIYYNVYLLLKYKALKSKALSFHLGKPKNKMNDNLRLLVLPASLSP